MERLGLTWVLVGGRPRCVSEFAGLPPAQRPAATCPECDHRLILKLGRVRRHHAAHAPLAACAATQPETALHIDLKLYLAAQLEAAMASRTGIVIGVPCQGAAGEECPEVWETPWLRDWDEVAVEGRIAPKDGRWRPDIVLRRRGQPIGAIEVLVTHSVSDDKAAALAGAGIPWVEIRADERMLTPEGGWRIGTALPVHRSGPQPDGDDGWRCERHWRRETRLVAARVVDVYREGGARERLIYRVDELRIEGVARALTLRRHGRDIATQSCDWSLKSQRAAWTALMAAFRSDVRKLGEPAGTVVDSPMRWARGDVAENLVHEALSDLQPGDPTPLATRYPRRLFFARERRRWFLPREMREVRWDRPLLDVFAAHPAWTASRSAVRERPVPEDAWSSFVFASRPVAASFHPGSDAKGVSVIQEGPIVTISLDAPPEGHRRALVVLSAAADDATVRRVARLLDDAGVEHVWVSHPRDWSATRSELAWTAAGRDSRGRGVVVVDGLGVFRAEAFARAFQRGDRKLSPDVLKRRMARRVATLPKP